MNSLAAQMQSAGAAADSDLGRHLSQSLQAWPRQRAASLRPAWRCASIPRSSKEAGEGFAAFGERIDSVKEGLLRFAEIAGIAFSARRAPGMDRLDAGGGRADRALCGQARRVGGRSPADARPSPRSRAATSTRWRFSSSVCNSGSPRRRRRHRPRAAALHALGIEARAVSRTPDPGATRHARGGVLAVRRRADEDRGRDGAARARGRGYDFLPRPGQARARGTEKGRGGRRRRHVPAKRQSARGHQGKIERTRAWPFRRSVRTSRLRLTARSRIRSNCLTKFVEGIDRAVKSMSAFMREFRQPRQHHRPDGGRSLSRLERGPPAAGGQHPDRRAARRPRYHGSRRPKPQVPELQLGGGGVGHSKNGGGSRDGGARRVFRRDGRRQAGGQKRGRRARQLGQAAQDQLEPMGGRYQGGSGNGKASDRGRGQSGARLGRADLAAKNCRSCSARRTRSPKSRAQEADAQAKAAEESAKAWDQFFKPLNSAIESQIGPLLKGTESLRTAFAKMAESLLADIAKIEVDKGLKGLESILTGGASGGTLAEVRAVAAPGDFSGAGAGPQAAASLAASAACSQAARWPARHCSSLARSVAQPRRLGRRLALRVGRAASSRRSRLSCPSSPPSIGSWEIPHDMVANVHAGEMIVPAQGGMADNFRSALANGGGATTITFRRRSALSIVAASVTSSETIPGTCSRRLTTPWGGVTISVSRTCGDEFDRRALRRCQQRALPARGSGSTLFVAAKPRFSFPGPSPNSGPPVRGGDDPEGSFDDGTGVY